MTSIQKSSQVATVINVFTVDPANQARLIETILMAVTQVISKMPGFISANLHKSADGTRVVNYVQWRSRNDFQAMLSNPETQAAVKKIFEIAKADSNVYEVTEIVAGSA